MYYSETKVIMGGLAHVPILIFIVNFVKGKFESIAAKVVEVKVEEPKVKVVEVETPWQDSLFALHQVQLLLVIS